MNFVALFQRLYESARESELSGLVNTTHWNFEKKILSFGEKREFTLKKERRGLRNISKESAASRQTAYLQKLQGEEQTTFLTI